MPAMSEKCVLVARGASGIGASIAQYFVNADMKVVLTGRSEAAVQVVAARF